ncbi:MAG: hypothetical protein GYB67_02885 [Chloroflexi bacterium]|nr:hypothetical protein [Chloroflexota bacterium]
MPNHKETQAMPNTNHHDTDNWVLAVTGPYQCGKTTFIHSLGAQFDPATQMWQLAVNPSLTIYFFEPHGPDRFDYIWELKDSGYLQGLIVLVDSTRPQTCHEARAVLEVFRHQTDTPAIVGACRQDDPDAWPLDDLSLLIAAPADVAVESCIATDARSAGRLLKTLMYQVLAHHSSGASV